MVELFAFLAGVATALLDDVADAPLFPEVEYGGEQFRPIAEVPVEAALGDAERLGKSFDAHARDAVVGKGADGRLDPCLSVEGGSECGCFGARAWLPIMMQEAVVQNRRLESSSQVLFM